MSYIVPLGVWFGAGKVCVSCVADHLPKRHTSRIAKAMKTCPAAKWYWRALNPKRSNGLLKLSSSNFFSILVQEHLTPRCACAARGNCQVCSYQPWHRKSLGSYQGWEECDSMSYPSATILESGLYQASFNSSLEGLTKTILPNKVFK